MLITWEHFHRVELGLRSNKSETYRRIWPDFFWNFGLTGGQSLPGWKGSFTGCPAPLGRSVLTTDGLALGGGSHRWTGSPQCLQVGQCGFSDIAGISLAPRVLVSVEKAQHIRQALWAASQVTWTGRKRLVR